MVSVLVTVDVDGKEIALETTAFTVREVLDQAGVVIGSSDRVEPDLWVEVEPEMWIRVVRIQEEVLVERETIPYAQQTVKSEALAVGTQKLLQAGKNGQAEVTYRLAFEDGVEAGRSILRRVVVVEPLAQITVVGVEGVAESVDVPGTVAYLNSGNAWILRGESGGRHPVTLDGDLDGQVFDLSPGGTHLLYSVPTDTLDFNGAFNELYVLDTVLANAQPVRLGIEDVLWAGWSPDGRQIAYSTGVKSSAPGWKANNDLWLATVRDAAGNVINPKPKRVLTIQSSGAYSWWPMRFFWSPDGLKIAYAGADQVGWIELRTRRVFPLVSFAPLSTMSDWVWTPVLDWSPDSAFVITSLHGVPEPGQLSEASQRFEVWAFALDNQVRARLVDVAGMWAQPRWSSARDGESRIVFAQSSDPFDSYDSRYALRVMDRDGSNKQDLFPARGEMGLTHPLHFDWSPDGHRLIVIYFGDLYLVNDEGAARQLTGDAMCRLVDWEN